MSLPPRAATKQAVITHLNLPGNIDQSRPTMTEATKPASRMPWHKALNRMADQKFLALSPAARSAMRDIDETVIRSGTITGKRGAICHQLGFEPKHFRYAIQPLIDGGLVASTEVDGVFTIDLPDDAKKSLGLLQASCKPPASTPLAPHKRNKKTANDAASGDPSLKKETTNVVEEEILDTPVVPQDEATQKARIGAFRFAFPKPGGSDEVSAWWAENNPDADEFGRIMARLEREKALYQQRPDFGKEQWRFFPSQAKFLLSRIWETPLPAMTDYERGLAENARAERNNQILDQWRALKADPNTTAEQFSAHAPLVKRACPGLAHAVDHFMHQRGEAVAHVG